MENKLTNFLFDGVGVPTYQKFLDLASIRHKLISGNVANISTPGYKARDIDFDSEFERATKSGSNLAGTITNKAHIPTGNHEARAPKPIVSRIKDGDMNSVDIDKEISNLAQNELRYTVGATMLQRKFEGLRKVIQSK